MKPETIPQEEAKRSSTEIESEIRQTRSRLDATLDEIANRLTARSIYQSASDWWNAEDQGSAALRSAAKTVYQQMKTYPAPALLIGGGLAWLISERIRDSGDGVVHEAEGALERSRELALKLKEEVLEGYEAGSEKIEVAYEAHPVATGLAVAALGSLAGFAIWRGLRAEGWAEHVKGDFFEDSGKKLKSCWKTLKS